MGNAMGPKKTLREELRENKRHLNRAIRELDRERANLQLQEKKTVMELKKMAKDGQIASVKIMAKDIVRIRQHVTKFYTMRSQLQAVSRRLETVKSTEAMTSAILGTTNAIKSIAKTMDMPRLNQIMREYTKETERMEMQQEMIGETIDDVMEADQDEEEEDLIVGQVLDEIGIDLTGLVPEAPLGSETAAKKSRVNEKPAVHALTADGPSPSQPSNPTSSTPIAPTLPQSETIGYSQTDSTMRDLEARLNNLRRS